MFVIVGVFAGVGPAEASTCVVPSSPYASPGDAVAYGTCSVIKLKPGVFPGAFVISRTVSIVGAGPGISILDGNGSGPVVENNANGTVLEGVTVQDGNAIPGGIRNRAGRTMTLRRVLVTENSAIDAAGIHNLGTMTILESRITNNMATRAAGIWNEGSLQIERSTIDNNQSSFAPAGIYQWGSATSLTLINTTVSGNRSDEGGAGLYLAADAEIRSSTISANDADADRDNFGSGGGILINGSPTVKLMNSILAGNRAAAGGNAPDCAGALTSLGGNVIGASDLCPVSGAGDVAGTSTSPVNPRLGPFANNGGATPTHAIGKTSPAYNRVGAGCAAIDQRGVPRGDRCDTGAYELTFCRGVAVNRVGTSGNDVLEGTSSADGILGFGGNDRLRGKGGKDGLCGGGGRDRLVGGGAKDKLSGGGSDDRLFGGPGNDRLSGGRGRDLCDGGGGSNTESSCEE